MKKKAGSFVRGILMLFAVALLCFTAGADVQAETPEQMKNMVVIYGISQGEKKVAANGFLIAGDGGNPVAVSVADSAWSEMDSYRMAGPNVEEQEISLVTNDSDSRLAIFSTSLSEGGCETSDMVSYSDVSAYTPVYAAGLDINGSAADGDDWEKEEFAMLDSQLGESNGYYYLGTIPSVSSSLIGAPLLLTDGRVVGILTIGSSDGCDYALCMDHVINLVQESGASSAGSSTGDGIGWQTISGTVFLLALIPVFAVVFVVSAILYANKQKKFRGNEQGEFANVLTLGGESGLQLLGVGGTFDGVKFPLEEKVIFGRDPSRCYAIYPEDVKGVSRVHCSVEVKDGKVILTDLGSSYGTFLENGEKLTAQTPYVLNYGASFYIVEPKNTFKVV